MTFLITLHIVVCVFLVAVILIQPGKGDAGISFGSSGQSIFASKSASNFLTKTTTICAIIFLLTSFFLTRGRLKEYNESVISTSESVQSESVQKEKVQSTESKQADSKTPSEKK